MPLYILFLLKLKEKIIQKLSKNKRPTSEHTINEDIPFPKIFLIGADGEKLGVKNTREAIEIAKEQGLDLVLISVEPKPIARILNYGKFKYERKKKQKLIKEKQTIIENRQIRLTPLIGENDLMVKSKKAREFILEGNRVKVSLKFRGREMSRQDLGYNVLNKFYASLEDIADIAKEAKLVNERFLDLYLQPNKNKVIKYKKDHNIIDKKSNLQNQEDEIENDNDHEQGESHAKNEE